MIIEETIYAKIIKKENKNIYISDNNKEFVYPESFVINYYNNLGFKGFFAESRFWWYSKKIVYKNILDLKSNKNNEELYMSFFKKYGSRQAEQMFYDVNKIKRKKQNEIIINEGFENFVNEDLIYYYHDPNTIILSKNDLIDVLNTFNKDFLFYMYEYLFDHFSEINPGNGLPDLIIYKPLKEVFFCEVKALNDTVKAHQKEWHNKINSNSQNITIMKIKKEK